MVCLLSFFLVQGLVDEHVRHQGSVAAGKVSDSFSPATAPVAFQLDASRHAPGQTRRALNDSYHTHHPLHACE